MIASRCVELLGCLSVRVGCLSVCVFGGSVGRVFVCLCGVLRVCVFGLFVCASVWLYVFKRLFACFCWHVAVWLRVCELV